MATRSLFYPNAVIATNPVSYWRLNEKSGTAGTDAMGNAPLTYLGSPTLGVTGAVNKDKDSALRITSPTTQYAQASNIAALSITGSFTVLAWVKPSAWPANTTARVIAKYDGTIVNYLLAWDSAGTSMRIVIETTGTGRTSTNAAAPSNLGYHLYVGTWDGTSLKLYIDNGAPAVTSPTGTLKTTANAATIGNTTGSGTSQGDIDDVAIWNRALSAAEISALYTAATT
jgi:hypothetical protein